MSTSNPGQGLILLALDGGGIRALSILLIIQALLKHVQKIENQERRARKERAVIQLRRPCEVFDFICGTGTGGIIALILGRLQMPIDVAIEHFTVITEEVFTSQRWFIGSKTAFRASVLEEALKRMCEEETGDAEELLISDESRPVFVCTRNALNANGPMLLRTYESVHASPTGCTIWEAARATPATPGLLDPIVIGRGQQYYDGGMGCNNPTKLLLSEAGKLFPGKEVACIVSIGSGHPATIHLANSNAPLETFKQIAVDCEQTHEELSERFERYPGIYRRFSVEQGMQTIKEDEIGTSGESEAHTNAYLGTHTIRQRLAETAKTILERRGVVLIDDVVSLPPRAAAVTAPVDEQALHKSTLKFIKEAFSNRLAAHYRYSDQSKDECHGATRQRVLDRIGSFIDHPSSEARCMWITGNAGVGKSVIAITATQYLLDGQPFPVANPGHIEADDPDRLNPVYSWRPSTEWATWKSVDSSAAEFQLAPRDPMDPELAPPTLWAHYFCNHLLDSSNIHTLLPTIAFQLAERSSSAAQRISDALKLRPTLMNKLSEQQADALFVKPLFKLAESVSPKVIVILIDGLDEFLPEPNTPAHTLRRQITDVLGLVVQSLPDNARLLIFSRPEVEFVSFLDQNSTHIQRFNLDTRDSIPDVRIFFADKLPRIRGHHVGFPTPLQLERLVQLSGGHLGWAKQTIRYLDVFLSTVNETRPELVDEEIDRIADSAAGDLYSLYEYLLTSLLRSHHLIRQRYLAGLQRALHLLVALEKPQSIDTICSLATQADGLDIRVCLIHLSGIYADRVKAVRGKTIPIPHKSFYEFLISPHAPDELRVDLPQAHTLLVRASFGILADTLHFNMGSFDSLDVDDQDIEKSLKRIPTQVQYACLSIMHHLACGEHTFETEVKHWIGEQFLYWFEIVMMSEVNLKQEGFFMRTMEAVKMAYPSQRAQIQRAIDFIEHFQWSSWSSRRPPQLYTTTIPFLPSSLRAIFSASSPPIFVRSKRDGRVRSVKDHQHCVFTSDGEVVAILSGSQLFVLWASTGHEVWPGQDVCLGRPNESPPIAFSWDNKTVVIATLTSIAEVCLILVDVGTGDQRSIVLRSFNMDGDLDSVWYVQIVGEQEFVGIHTFYGNSICVYRDGQLLWTQLVHRLIRPHPVLLSDDKILIPYNDELHVHCNLTGKHLFKTGELDDLVLCGAVSSTGTVVLGLGLEAIAVLDASIATEGPVETMEVADGAIHAVSFSQDGQFLAVGTHDGSIQLWRTGSDLSEWTRIFTSSGAKSGRVKQVAFRAGGKQLLSYSDDGIIRVWDISAIVDDREWVLEVNDGALLEGGWFKRCIPRGGWFASCARGERPEPFNFEYPFKLPDGLAKLEWDIEASSKVEGEQVWQVDVG